MKRREIIISILHLVILPKIGQAFVKCKPHKHSNLLEPTSYLEIIVLFPTFNILWIIDGLLFSLVVIYMYLYFAICRPATHQRKHPIVFLARMSSDILKSVLHPYHSYNIYLGNISISSNGYEYILY